MSSEEKQSKNQIVYGKHAVMEALEAGKTFEKLLLQKSFSKQVERQFGPMIRERSIPVQFVPVEKLNRLTQGNHQGVVGYLPLIDYYKLSDILPHIYEKGQAPLLLILDRVSDVRNFGAICRTAEGMGVHCIIVPQKGSAAINAEAIKASAGTLHKIPVCRENGLADAIGLLKLNGLKIIATDASAKKPIKEGSFSEPVAVIMGEEGDGVSQDLLALADEVLSIPMHGTVDSFNVSVAAGMILYEASRQRD